MEIKGLQGGDYGYFLELYEESFPASERRYYAGPEDFGKFLNERKGLFSVIAAYDGGDFLGFLSYWRFSDFAYIEHFAVMPSRRGEGIGGELLKYLIKNVSDKVLLEVELPDTDEAVRRISFYVRNGFRLRPEFSYMQPPYSPSQPPVPMLLMTYGSIPLKDKTEISEMLQEVYGA